MTERLVSHWKFENNTLDSEGGNNGTATMSVYDDGVVAGTKAALFSVSDPNKIVAVPYANELNTQSFTVSAWVKATGNANNYRAVMSSRNAPYIGYTLYATSGNEWEGWLGTGSNWTKLGTNNVLLDDEWVHVVMTFDTTSVSDDNTAYTGTCRVYFNGVLDRESTSAKYVVNPDAQMLIGAGANEADAPNYLFEGLIDDVRCYSYAVSKTDIAIMYTDVMTSEIVCTENPELDFTGPAGVPDCIVDLYEVAALAATWMECNVVPNCLN